MNFQFNVSVIIPVYNAEKYVRKAVESAITIDVVKEIILIEDGSPDDALLECKKLVEEYKIVKLLRHPEGQNRGAGASRNLGILNAQYDFIAFLDADDVYLPSRFERDLELFLNDKSVEGVYNAVGPYAIDSDGEGRMKKLGAQIISMRNRLRAEELFENIEPIGGAGFFHLDGITLKKSVIDKTGLMNTELMLSQDTHFSIKLAAVCKLLPGELENTTALYGVHEANRCQFPEKITANRPYLFYDLYNWAIKKKLGRSRVNLLWERYYYYHLLVNKPTRGQQLSVLAKEGFKNISLLTSSFFCKQLPLLHRLIS